MADDIKKPGDLERQVKDGSILKDLIRIFRTNTVVKHHFQSTGNPQPQGVAKMFFKNAYSFRNSVIPGYSSYDRFARISDYAEMEVMSTLSNALNIVSDEVTQKNEKGKTLEITSENEKVKKALTELFEDVLKLGGKNLWKTVRNMLKYGDCFYLIDITEDNGVINLIRMPANEVEREEGFDKDDPAAIRFRWTAKQNIEIPNAFVAHFRLEGNDLFHPYGTSFLEAARRPWRQLTLLEDAMMAYRISRAPERKVFFLDIGGIPQDAVEPTLNKFNESIKKKHVVDQNGRIDLRNGSALPVWKNTPIPLLDGRTITIENLAKEFEEGKENWVYSIQEKTLNAVPGKVVWCGKNYTAEKMIKVWLDDNTWVMMAPEHPVLVWNEDRTDFISVEAKDLKPEMSCVALYRKTKSEGDGKFLPGYERIWDHGKKRHIMTHQMVGNSVLSEDRQKFINDKQYMDENKYLVVHHMDFNKVNNHPNNLKWMGNVDHARYHAETGKENIIKYNKSDAKRKRTTELNKEKNSVAAMKWYNSSELHKKHNEIRREAQKKSWTENSEKRKEAISRIEISKEVIETAIAVYKEKGNGLPRDKFGELLNSDERYLSEIKKCQIGEEKKKGMHFRVLLRKMNVGYEEFKKLSENNALNHKIQRIEEICQIDDVYCMTVVGPNGEDDRHNFAASTFDIDGNVSKSAISLRNSLDEDYVIPVRGNDTATRIETLPGGQNLGDIEDVEYIRSNLFAALGIPKAFLTFDQDIRSKQVLTQEDIRFARTVARIQEVLVSELIKIAMIHLYIKGFRGDDLVNFKIQMTNPSTVAELQKMELWRARMDLVMSAKEGVFDTTFIYKEFLQLTENQVENIRKGQIQDKIFQAKLIQLENSQGLMQGAGTELGMMGGGGAMGGSLGGMPGGDMGAMGGSQLGGAPPDMGAAPPPEAAPVDSGVAGEAKGMKDLFRDPSGDTRKKERRGLAGTDVTGAGDLDDDPNDFAGIRRTISSPMGGRETVDLGIEEFKSLFESYKAEEPIKSVPPMGMSQEYLDKVFGETTSKNTKTLLKEANKDAQVNLHEKLGFDIFEKELQKIEADSEELLNEVYNRNK